MSKKTKIVIIGAGFGGIEFVKALHKKPVEVLLIDRNNYHNFQPLMYQVATGGLEILIIWLLLLEVKIIFSILNRLRQNFCH